MTDTEFWTQWEGQLVAGAFPLRRLLGCSAHSAVFLTEHKAKSLPAAAIKFVRVDATQGKAQLAQWEAAATLDHPHLVRLFGRGRYRVGEHEFVFIVMEYADQTLAEILRRRALDPEELREMLIPALDALTFLHRRHLVHGRLRPSNVLAVDDQLKLSSDTIVRVGHRADVVEMSAYDSPELKDQGISTADDIWSLGATLAEALTQRVPSRFDPQFETDLPAGVPTQLVDTVRRCLSVSHADRPSVIELRSEYKTATRVEPVPEARPQVQPPSQEKPQSEPQLQAPIKPPPQSAAQLEQAKSQPQPQTQSPPEIKSLPLPEAKAQLQPQPQATSQPLAQSQLSPSLRPQSQPQVESRLLPESQPQQPSPSPPRSQPEAKPHPQPQSQPLSQSQPQAKLQAPAQSQPQAKPLPLPLPTNSQPQPQSQPAASSQPPTRSQPPVNWQPPDQSQSQPKPQPQIKPQALPESQLQAKSQPLPQSPPQAKLQPQSQLQQPPPPLAAAVSALAASVRASASAPLAVAVPPSISVSAPVAPPATVAATKPTSARVSPPAPIAEADLLPRQKSSKGALLVVAAAVAISIAVWFGFRAPSAPQVSSQPTVVPAQPPAAPPTIPEPAVAESRPVAQPAPPTTTSPSVLHEVMPTVPANIQRGIQGRIYVTVRVLVDPAGNAIAVLMESPGPSKYFARLADNAAREWQFVPTDNEGDRVWLVTFTFTRDDITTRAVEQ